VVFEDNCVQTNKHRLILSAVQMSSRHSRSWRYKVYADIRRGSLKRKHQTTVGSCVNTRAAHAVALFYSLCMCNKSAGSSDVGFGNYGDRK